MARKTRKNDAPRFLAPLPGMRIAEEIPDGIEPPGLYSEWHAGKKPNGLAMARFKWPKIVYPFAQIIDIQYKSDKFDSDWDIYTYVHGASSKPEIWADFKNPDVDGFKSEDFLSANIIKKCVNLPALAVLQSVDFEGEHGVVHLDFENRPEGPPNLSGTDDHKTLVILHPKWPMFIYNGIMEVTAAGVKK